ncbi:MAG: hypothetical protein L0Z50_22005 [Verrucomicrobiales bacterium]|nr:hypothetical protein [Verrucomicrobiales bacterium]
MRTTVGMVLCGRFEGVEPAAARMAALWFTAALRDFKSEGSHPGPLCLKEQEKADFFSTTAANKSERGDSAAQK